MNEYLKMHEIYMGDEDLNLLMFRLDKNNDGRITMEEVIFIILLNIFNFSSMMKYILEIENYVKTKLFGKIFI